MALLLAGVIFFFCLDGLLFRIGPYPKMLEPDSSTGLFEEILYREQQAQKKNGDNLVATFGDSRMAYYPRVSAQVSGRTGILLRNAGVAGSSARVWYYMLRDLDPTASRYRAIVIGVNGYEDEDEDFNPADDLRSVHYVAARLRLADIPEFTASFESSEARWQAFRWSLFKGFAFQQDILAFLTNPSKRLAVVKQANAGYETWTWDYVETKRNMVGLQIDWAARKATFPADFDENQRATVNNFLLHPPALQAGRLAKYRRLWFGKIIDRYRGSRTKIIFVSLARGPIVHPENPAQRPGSVIRDFGSLPEVRLANERAFESLEHPELFKDGLHFNDEGCTRFSIMMSEEVARLLGTSARAGNGN